MPHPPHRAPAEAGGSLWSFVLPKHHIGWAAITAFCMLLIVAAWWVALERIAFERDQAIESAEQQNANLALAYEEHIVRTLRGVDQSLLAIKRAVERGAPRNEIAHLIEEAINDGGVYSMISVFDRDGYTVDVPLHVKRIDVADREYFKALRDSDAGLYIDKPVIGRLSGNWVLPLARRIETPDGRFAGIVVATVRPTYFTDFYGHANLGRNGLVTLIGLDGIARVRRAGDTSSVGVDMRHSTLYRAQTRRAAGSFVSLGTQEGVPRVVSYRRLPQFSGIVAVGTSVSETLEPFEQRRRGYLMTAGAATALVLVFLSGYLVISGQHRRSVAALVRSEAALAESQTIAQLGTWEIDLTRTPRRGRPVLYWSDEVYRIFGIEPGSEVTEELFYGFVCDEDRERVREAVERAIATTGRYAVEFCIALRNGTRRHLQANGKVTFDPALGNPLRFIGAVRDITEQKSLEALLLRQANYDTLTGLPNRRLFQDRLQQTVAQAQRRAWKVTVLFIDLDKFTTVNDTLGHAMGDDLLQQVARRLTARVRAEDTVARLGGDEFAVIACDLGDAQEAATIAQQIIQALQEPVVLDGHEVLLTASIGIASYPDDSPDADALMKNADTAMYRAKELTPNSYQFYTEEMNRRALERLLMIAQMKRALERGEFELEYQPKVEAHSGRITGCEALLRWRRDGRDLAPPADFVPALESSGLVVPVGDWVIERVCAQLQEWRSRGREVVPVAINLSARQFENQALVETVCAALRSSGLPPCLLQLEITESTAMRRPEENVHTLRRIRDLGVGLAIDDFGTGYSSLSYLKRFPIDSLKIDRSFVRGLPDNQDDASIARAIVVMAHNLSVKVVAEGVETAEQLRFLVEHGCEEIQGFYYYRPLGAHELEVRLPLVSGLSAAA